MEKLLNLENVNLKSICWPSLKCIGKYYDDEERKHRIEKFIDFMNETLKEHMDRRKILCDPAAKYGNQILINNEVAIIGNRKSGGYTETSVFGDQQMLDTLVREYDNLFNQILKTKINTKNLNLKNDRRLNKLLGLETLIMADNELNLFRI